ncbi:ribonuclease Z [Planctomycetes bacterium Pan216]|uniref:Ribonuclease Z n=1 Tax=Kolteria novifilia TaxID=2527975 RepID=A0A518B807_9BACT|nr:ribonuclease Z [Planctomycetes bacterium Pan216]
MLRLTTLAFVLSSLLSASSLAESAQVTFRQPDAKAFPNLFVWTDTCNTYVLRDGNAALLVDLGDGSVLEHLSEIGVKRVEWILFTHHHREQCQGIGAVDRSETKIAAPFLEQEIFENPTSFRKWYPTLNDKFSVYGASYVRPHREPISLDRVLKEDETFTWRGYQIDCLSTPGHSPGSMTYLLRQGDKLAAFSGDLIHQGSRMVTWFDTEWDYGFADGINKLIESVTLVSKREPDLLLPSHGPPIVESKQELKAYHDKLWTFRKSYLRGYPVFDATEQERDPISKPTKVPMINQVTPHLYKLSHLTKSRNFAIIVADSGHALVLDCGLIPESKLEEIIVGMRAHMGLKHVDAFWISHMHGDHFLLGPALKRMFNSQAWTLDTIVDKCEHPRRYDYAALVSAYGNGFDGMKIDKGFKDGETIEWEGYTIHVDWMPGQTEFGCCLWLDIDGKRIAFTGDNLFGSPADPKQNGHECIVARNSSIFEEGYIYGSRYLKELEPDIVMGSHSYAMPDPAKFLERYHDWSKEIVEIYKELLPEEDYEYLYDPYWVSAYPYRVDLANEETQTVQITVRNFRSMPQRHRVELQLPKGITAKPAILDGLVGPERRRTYDIELTVDRDQAAPGLQIVPFDITLDGKRYGQWFDFLLRTTEE